MHRGQCSTVNQPALGLILKPHRGQIKNAVALSLAASSSVAITQLLASSWFLLPDAVGSQQHQRRDIGTVKSGSRVHAYPSCRSGGPIPVRANGGGMTVATRAQPSIRISPLSRPVPPPDDENQGDGTRQIVPVPFRICPHAGSAGRPDVALCRRGLACLALPSAMWRSCRYERDRAGSEQPAEFS
jgi:hypothetical protein